MCLGVGFEGQLHEGVVGKLQYFCEVTGFDCREAGQLREKLYLPEVLILLEVSNIGLRLLVQDSNQPGDYEVHSSSLVTLCEDVVIYREGLFLEIFSDLAEEIDLEILEHYDVLEDPPIQERPHLDFKVLVQHRKYLFLIDFDCLLAVENVFKVAADLQPQVFRDLFSNQELIHVGHFLFVLSCVHIVPRNQVSNGTNRVSIDDTGDQHREKGQGPLLRRVRVNVTIPDSGHGGERPVEGEDVLGVDIGLIDAVGYEP